MSSFDQAADRINAAVEKAEIGSEILSQVANGDEFTEVPTTSGPVPSLKKWQKDNMDLISGGVIARVDKAILSYPDYATASAAAATLPDGQFVVADADDVRGVVSGGGVSEEQSIYKVADYAKVRNYTGRGTRLRVVDPTGAHWWVRRGTLPANGGTVLVDALGRSWEREYKGPVFLSWFGAVGDGVSHPLSSYFGTLAEAKAVYPNAESLTDEIDFTALSSAIGWCSEVGGSINVPTGNFLLNKGIYKYNQTKQFRIVGSGRYSTKFTRSAQFNGAVFEFGNCDGLNLESFSVDAKHSVFPFTSLGHGIAVGRSNNALVKDIAVRDYADTGIIVLNILNDYTVSGCIVDNCEVDGLNVAGNGILIGGLVASGISKSTVRNINKAGSPGYGLQLKNKCRGCFIIDSRTYGAKAGVAFGNDISQTGVTDSFVSNVYAFDCTYGATFGFSKNNKITNLIIDMNGSGNSPIYFNQNNDGNFISGVIAKGIIATTTYSATQATVTFDQNNTNNTVEVDSSEHLGTTFQLSRFYPATQNNRVFVDKCVSHSVDMISSAARFDDTAVSGNSLSVSGVQDQYQATISGDTLTLKNSFVRRVKVDTEGSAASDNLSIILGGKNGQIITIQSLNNNRDTTVKHGVGNIRLAGGVDFTLAAASDSITLIYDTGLSGGTSAWCEMYRASVP